MRRSTSLTQQNALWLSAAFLALELVAALAVAWFLMLPMARRASGDFAELLALSAETWSELPPSTRPAFERHLMDAHGIDLRGAAPDGLRQDVDHGPYVRYLEQTLSKEIGRPVKAADARVAGEDWHWVELPSGGRTLWLGFPHSRIGTQPLPAIFLTLAAGFALAVLAAWWLARRIVAPLRRRDAAAAVLGRGETPELLPEKGPREIAALSRRINVLAREVHELLDGRTTLLAGLSHDLRTPLARMRLALEMLSRRPDPSLIERLEKDIEEMNRLVGDMLELARGLGREAPVNDDVEELLDELAAGARAGGANVDVSAETSSVNAPPMALRRLLGNLLSNAQRYGAGGPVELRAVSEDAAVRIGVLDRGPGIPADQIEAVFRPFHRVEPSRNPVTGGSGLGLAIVRQLAQANGWTVSLENRSGGGLAAWITVPTIAPST
ncbi:MAG: HAMP domain-containing protein [Gammaproteobacteria bacterium]|nr:HAMP domain-containing protein [Gammaproteobacteria bacterium]